MLKKLSILIVLSTLILFGAGCANVEMGDNQKGGNQAVLRFINKNSRGPLKGLKVTVNGVVMCITEPCPGFLLYSGETNEYGEVDVDYNVLNKYTALTVAVDGIDIPYYLSSDGNLLFNVYRVSSSGGIVSIGEVDVTKRAVVFELQVNGENPLFQGTIAIRLVDAFSGENISNVEVKVHTYITPVEEEKLPAGWGPVDKIEEWTGRTDDDGVFVIPVERIREKTVIAATGYRFGRNLNIDSEEIDRDNWFMELNPDSKIDSRSQWIKIFDSQTREPIKNTAVRIFNNYDHCDGVTNFLGNVYCPMSLLISGGNAIDVAGYSITKFSTTFEAEFEGYKVYLKPN